MDLNNKQTKITLEQLIAHKQRRNPIFYSIYGVLRLLIIIAQNIYSIVSYFILSWILFLPFIWLKSDVYTKLENYLYNSLLFIVTSWSVPAGLSVVETGDDYKPLIEGKKYFINSSLHETQQEENQNHQFSYIDGDLKAEFSDINSGSKQETKQVVRGQKKYYHEHGEALSDASNCYTNGKRFSDHQDTDIKANNSAKISVEQLNGYSGDTDDSEKMKVVAPLVDGDTHINTNIQNATTPLANNHLNHTDFSSKDSVSNLKDFCHNIANPRVLLICNHISTADVPLIMQALSPLTKMKILWIMDAQFKMTNFGLVSWSHDDFFIAKNKFIDGSLKDHLQKHPERNLIVLFPEGGFWRKRIEGSNRYAKKNNLPITKYVTHPRFGAFKDLIHPSLNITHIVDATLLYDNLKNPISILDIIAGWRKEAVILKYKVYEKSAIIVNEDWLRNIWLEKDKLLHRFYTDRNSVYEQIQDSLRIIQLDWLKVLIVNVFYILVFYLLVYKVVNL